MIDTAYLIIAFIFGAVVGSFLNVVALRYNTGKGLGGRSMCMNCGKGLAWFELLPIASFMFQRGACKGCKSRISWQYPTIEFLAGIIFVMIFLSFPPYSLEEAITLFIHLLAASLLLVIVVYDSKHKIIPDPLVYTFDALALVNLFIGGVSLSHLPSIEALISGPLLALPFALIWVISRGRWMGLGDSKLVLGIGWFLGINAGINAIILSFWIGAFVSVIWLFYTYKRFKPRTEIPFGPYLILGMYLVMLFGVQIIDIGLLRELLLGI